MLSVFVMVAGQKMLQCRESTGAAGF